MRPAGVGGCLLATLVADSTISDAQLSPGCHLAAAVGPGVGGQTSIVLAFDGAPRVGDTLPARSRLWALCDTGVVNAPNKVTLDNSLEVPVARGWSTPSTVNVGNLSEPIVVGDAAGDLYYSPHNRLFRSQDGGQTWSDVSPGDADALPVYFSDTSVSVAPDGTVWWARNWGDIDSTVACRSTTKGESWSCNSSAISGITDRMWIVGVSDDEALLESSHGAQQPEWTHTTDGGLTYVPYATTQEHGSYGNIVRDSSSGAAWQTYVENSDGAHLHLMRVDPSQGPVLTSVTTPIVRSDGLPIIGYADETIWASGEPVRADGSRGLTINRSRDGGATWETFEPPNPAATVVFSAVAAAPGGQVSVAYYGSDVAADPEHNGGHWSLYVAQTRNGLTPHPHWTVTEVVPNTHVGSICWFYGCESAETDPHGRYAGDFMAPWISPDGTTHLPVVRDHDDDGLSWAQYVHD